jgi:pimeloyl-ACP methyl ester carboxylesterase
MVGIIAAALIALAAAPAQAEPAPPAVEPAACPALALKAPAFAGARCGFLVVPENRTVDNGKTIRLLVAIVPARSPTPAPDPVVHLTGGPGGIAILEAQELVDAGFNADRDLILLDQRGTKYSEPALICPDIDRYQASSLALPLDGRANERRHVRATAACRARLTREGADLSAYNTTENAADVADLRKALGIAEWNVFGVSYGTDLALTLLRDHPEGIRTVTIDSVVPPNAVKLSAFWPNASHGFHALFAACAKQRSCRKRHPHLEATFTGLVRRLEAHPVTVRVRPATGGNPVPVTLDGGALANWLVSAALDTPTLRHVPAIIGALAAGDAHPIAAARLANVAPAGFVGYGLVYGVACGEWVPYEPASAIVPAGRRVFPAYPRSVLGQAPQFTFMTQDCRAWNVPPQPATQHAAVTSTVPTLVLEGGFDSIAPLAWGQLAAQTLANSTVTTYPGIGHFVIPESPCAQRVFASFLANPNAPDTGCVAGLRPPPFRG